MVRFEAEKILGNERRIRSSTEDGRPPAGSSQPRPPAPCQSLPPHPLTFADAQVEGQSSRSAAGGNDATAEVTLRKRRCQVRRVCAGDPLGALRMADIQMPFREGRLRPRPGEAIAATWSVASQVSRPHGGRN